MLGGAEEGGTNLVLIEHSPEAVEELERRDYLALYQCRGENRSCCPPACAERHLPEPGLEREASCLSAHHLIHLERLLRKLEA